MRDAATEEQRNGGRLTHQHTAAQDTAGTETAKVDLRQSLMIAEKRIDETRWRSQERPLLTTLTSLTEIFRHSTAEREIHL